MRRAWRSQVEEPNNSIYSAVLRDEKICIFLETVRKLNNKLLLLLLLGPAKVSDPSTFWDCCRCVSPNKQCQCTEGIKKLIHVYASVCELHSILQRSRCINHFDELLPLPRGLYVFTSFFVCLLVSRIMPIKLVNRFSWNLGIMIMVDVPHNTRQDCGYVCV